MINHPSISILVGKCKAGKSHMLKYLLYELGCKTPIQMIQLFSRTSYNGQYNYIPEQRHNNELDLSKIRNIIRMQKRHLKAYGKCIPIVLVIDDGINKKNQCEDFLNLINAHRHFNISVIVCMQYLAGNISTNFREVADNCFIFKADTQNSIQSNFNAFVQSVGKNIYEYTEMNKNLDKFCCFYINKPNGTIEVVKAPSELPDYEFIYKEKAEL